MNSSKAMPKTSTIIHLDNIGKINKYAKLRTVKSRATGNPSYKWR